MKKVKKEFIILIIGLFASGKILERRRRRPQRMIFVLILARLKKKNFQFLRKFLQ